MEREGKIIPIEVKMTSKIRKEMAKGLSLFIRLYKDEVGQGYIVTISGESLQLDKKIRTQPFDEFLFELL